MKIDQREFDEAAENQNGPLPEGLTGTSTSVLDNPVLPSEFDLFVPANGMKRTWEFGNRNPVPFDKVWKCLRGRYSHPVRGL